MIQKNTLKYKSKTIIDKNVLSKRFSRAIAKKPATEVNHCDRCEPFRDCWTSVPLREVQPGEKCPIFLREAPCSPRHPVSAKCLLAPENSGPHYSCRTRCFARPACREQQPQVWPRAPRCTLSVACCNRAARQSPRYSDSSRSPDRQVFRSTAPSMPERGGLNQNVIFLLNSRKNNASL